MTLALLGCAVLCAPGAVPLLADDLADFEAALQADAQSSAKPGDSNGISNAVVAGSDPLNLGFTIDFGLFGFSKKDHRAHGGHMANRNGPSIQGVELTAGSAIDPFFRFDLQYQFTHQHFEEMVIETTALPGNLVRGSSEPSWGGRMIGVCTNGLSSIICSLPSICSRPKASVCPGSKDHGWFLCRGTRS